MLKRKVIVDFDNTFFEDGCDVDDALALRYLLNCDNVEILGVCTTYGNSTIDVVNENTYRLFEEWNISLPVYKGATSPVSEQANSSEASGFIVKTLTEYPGQIDILALGSTTNLGQAVLQSINTNECNILDSARSLIFMGGITEPLIINSKIMNELNLSSDSMSTYLALGSNTSITIATAHNCLPVFFTRADFIQNFGETSSLYLSCIPWFEQMDLEYSLNGWTCWDVVAAAYLAHSEYFTDHENEIVMSRKNFETGYLDIYDSKSPCLPNCNLELTYKTINLPKIKDAKVFKDHVMDKWRL